MGLFDLVFPKKAKVIHEQGRFETFTGYQPIFTGWNQSLYENQLVRASIDARARNVSKLKVEIEGNPQVKNALKHHPNSWQTWGQFLYRLCTILDIRNTAFIVPMINNVGEITGVYPIMPTDYELVEYKGVPYLRFTFQNREHACMELSKVGIMTKYQFKSDFFGESNNALTPTMELINIQNQGIQEGVKSSATYRFMAKASNFTTDEDLAKERQNFSRNNLESGGGLLLFPHTYTDIKQIDSKPFVVDADQMNIIQRNVYDYFGVNDDVLQNKAFGDSWEAFYEGAIEPFAIQFSEVMTKMLFTPREQSSGSRVFASANRLQYMSTDAKLRFIEGMGDRGMITIDDAREVFNMPPLPDEKGKVYIIRGEYYNTDGKIVNNGGNENGQEE